MQGLPARVEVGKCEDFGCVVQVVFSAVSGHMKAAPSHKETRHFPTASVCVKDQ